MIIWDIRVPIFKNRLILKQLGIAIGIPFGLLTVIFLLLEAYYGFLLVVSLLLLTYLFVMLIFKGTYDVRFVISEKGILCENQPRQQKRLKRISALTFVLGLFALNPAAAGAGLLAGSRTKFLIPWKRIRKVKYLKKQRCILCYGGFGENIALFCTQENYHTVRQVVSDKVNIKPKSAASSVNK
jgi:hypothetical protein